MYEKGNKLHGRIEAFTRPSGSTIESQRLIILRKLIYLRILLKDLHLTVIA